MHCCDQCLEEEPGAWSFHLEMVCLDTMAIRISLFLLALCFESGSSENLRSDVGFWVHPESEKERESFLGCYLGVLLQIMLCSCWHLDRSPSGLLDMVHLPDGIVEVWVRSLGLKLSRLCSLVQSINTQV